MNAEKSIKISSKIYIGFSAFCLGYVAFTTLLSPQSTMDLVAVILTNNDAISSIRGIYGGVGLVLSIQLVYLLIKDYHKGLIFLSLFWSSYAISRLITIQIDGPLGDFGIQWIIIETILSAIGIILWWVSKKFSTRTTH